MATATARTVGKTEFVKEVLGKNPHANPTAVNEEWKSAGQDGTISATLVNKLRSSMGLAGNLRPTPKTKTKTRSRSVKKRPPSGKNRGEKLKRSSSETVPPAPSRSSGKKTDQAAMQNERRAKVNSHHGSLEELECDIDRLLFKVMELGGLAAIEDSLRQTRRLLYGGFSGKRS
jgi:hypothetical protein